MAEHDPASNPNACAITIAHAALNRGDIDAFVAILHPEVEWIEPAGFPGAGTTRGFDAVRAHLAKQRGNWAEGVCEPRRLTVAGERIVQLVHVHVRLKGEADWRDGDVAEVYTFRADKVSEIRLFADDQAALAWAGIHSTPSDAGEPKRVSHTG